MNLERWFQIHRMTSALDGMHCNYSLQLEKIGRRGELIIIDSRAPVCSTHVWATRIIDWDLPPWNLPLHGRTRSQRRYSVRTA